MHQADIVTLYDYNYWATRRIVGAAANLTTEQLTAPTPLSWGSVRDVLTHALSAEWAWRLRCQEGLAPTRLLDPAEFPTLDALLGPCALRARRISRPRPARPPAHGAPAIGHCVEQRRRSGLTGEIARGDQPADRAA